MFREIFNFREDKSKNIFHEILKCFRKTAKFEFFAKLIIYLEIKFKGPSGFMVECILYFNSHNSGNFHPNEENKISKSKLGSPLSNT